MTAKELVEGRFPGVVSHSALVCPNGKPLPVVVKHPELSLFLLEKLHHCRDAIARGSECSCPDRLQGTPQATAALA